MATLYRDTGYSLMHLIEDIKQGNIALPEIQRPFVWSSAKTRDLFDSMYRGYPVGTLLFWETGADVGTRQIGGGGNEKVAKLLIVDGQQRLTSLFAVLTGQSDRRCWSGREADVWDRDGITLLGQRVNDA